MYASRVVIVQPALPRYRLRLFNMISEKVPLLLVYSGASPEGVMSVDGERGFDVSIIDEVDLLGKLFWQKGVVSIVLRENISNLVIGGNPRYLSSVIAILIAKFRKIPVVVWGHSMSSTSGTLRTWIRMRLMQFADTIMLYYPEEIERLPHRIRSRAIGVDNSIDTKAIFDVQESISNADVASVRTQYGLCNTLLLITIGRITAKANLGLVIKAVTLARQKQCQVKLVVIGDGPESAKLARLCNELNVSESIIWLGELYDERNIGVWMKAADAFVYGGAVGLSLIHAFAYGLPAIISSDVRDHNPEALLFRSGHNGATFERDDPASLAHTICEHIANPGLLRKMGENAHRVAHERLGIERMASRFLDAIENK